MRFILGILIVLVIFLLVFSIWGIQTKYKALIECESKGGLLIERHIDNYVCIKPEILK